ncbi:transcriptional regulator, ArsR family [Polynucleobacter meluiroseus]|uniref:Transcriptional regulator, ArsR family n=1 Tax=Polynucleobacter meluiroseus TaxID=1938814 RepID=A0A240E0H6_9BURK|nr:helix-turn-helix domain-containing protein [Polynucleobacter meluiroseus]SNX28717.1 transcriptional regulator, ArsR family [Polynucleobacter meluiroseus]
MNNAHAISAFLALGQETRLNVFRLIVQRGEEGLTPSQIIEKLGIPNATLSFHLKDLLNADLLLVERQSRNLLYRPNAAQVQKLSEFLLDNCCGGKPCIPSQTLKKAKTK